MSFPSFPFPNLGPGTLFSKPSTFDPVPSCQLAACAALWIHVPSPAPPSSLSWRWMGHLRQRKEGPSPGKGSSAARTGERETGGDWDYGQQEVPPRSRSPRSYSPRGFLASSVPGFRVLSPAAPALGQVTPDPPWQLPVTFLGTYYS